MSPDVRNQPQKLCLCCQKEFPAELTVCPDDGMMLTAIQSAGLVGQTFDGKYEILDVIGGGGMGQVYRAKHLLLKRIVAIKVLHKEQISTGTALKRFQVEAQSASSLSMPHIITVHDFGTSPDGQPFMVMDYLDGRSLFEVLASEGRLPPDRAVNIFIQIASALGYAHSKGIIHRDIKPSNIVLIENEGTKDFVKLVDFGIAKLMNVSDESGNLTRTGEVFGSALYMSPEQCRALPLDSRTDIYSLGSVMYRVLSGNPMFPDGDMLQLAYKHLTELPPSIAAQLPAVSQELEAIVFKALAKDPADRFQSMEELRAALEALVPASGKQRSVTRTGEAIAPPPAPRAVLRPPEDITRPGSTIRTTTQQPLPAPFVTPAVPEVKQYEESTNSARASTPSSEQTGELPGQASSTASEEVTDATGRATEPPREQTIQIVVHKKAVIGGAVAAVLVIACGALAFVFSGQPHQHDVQPPVPKTPSSVAEPGGANPAGGETAGEAPKSTTTTESQTATEHSKPHHEAHHKPKPAETATAPARSEEQAEPPPTAPAVARQPVAPPTYSRPQPSQTSMKPKHHLGGLKNAFKRLMDKVEKL